MTKHWLETICIPRLGKEIMQRPHLLRWRDADWTAATDGRVLILLRGVLCAATTSDVTAKLQPMLDAATSEPLDWVRFREWIGPEPVKKPCRQCGGDGKCNGCHCEAEHDCGYCDGTGKVEPDPFPVVFRGHVLDRHRLVRIVGNLDGAQVKMAWAGNPNVTASAMLVIDGDGWRVCLMPMEGSGEGLPAFEETPCATP